MYTHTQKKKQTEQHNKNKLEVYLINSVESLMPMKL